MKTSTIVWIIVIIVLAGIGWYFLGNNYSGAGNATQNTPIDNSQTTDTSPTTTTTSTTTTVTTVTPTTQSVPMMATVTYGPNGFSPSTVTIAKGGTITFTNTGGDEMWVASAPPPTPEGYSGTTKGQHCPDTARIAFDQCSAGSTDRKRTRLNSSHMS